MDDTYPILRTLDFLKRYWSITKEIILVLAAVLYFAISFRVAPLITRIDALESSQESLTTTLGNFITATNQRFTSNEATVKSLSDTIISSGVRLEDISRNVETLLKMHLRQ